MRKMLFALALVAMLIPLSAAQDSRIPPPVTTNENSHLVSANRRAWSATRKGSYYPPFCQPNTCLYYAGDYDSNYSDAGGLFNANDEGGSLEGQAWVGVKPDRDVTVTGATFVESLAEGVVGVNPTPFAVQVGIKLGQAGKMICSTSGNATVSEYGYVGAQIPAYSYSIKKLSKSCKLKKGRLYYVNLLPTFDDDYGYVLNVPPKSHQNHHGWKNDLNDCFFNGVAFGDNYVTCNSQGHFSEFSIALTGKE
jgi:hypothetical protein